ncbi:twin-arginine translocase TatA/TatE family subunit [Flaviflexus huanghaiensis]|uniref:twin-arginine translocase TatA/TatE family subunit n=1 Tax=Flaviflexus huanghaiensis TaxID=1111473 RepID=UPI0015FC5D93|nr:twin-arginine translocase TatA/TatE family subunit [Flaviflexus huanghaiensis]
MGINTTEFIVIALILVVIVGPEKLPELAAQLGRLIREVKAIATGAKARVEEELGPDFEELKNLDPRQYDPRRIVRDALKDEPPARVPSRTSRPVSTPRTAPAAAVPAAAQQASGQPSQGNTTPANESSPRGAEPAAQSATPNDQVGEPSDVASTQAVDEPARESVPFDDEAT